MTRKGSPPERVKRKPWGGSDRLEAISGWGAWLMQYGECNVNRW